jgi:hypothetical protein
MKYTKIVLILTMLIFSPALSFGDALFIHDYDIDEFLMGEQKIEISNGYRNNQMRVELKKDYTGTWMKRIFGKVKQDRQTTIFFLDKDEIHGIDWNMDKIIIYPLHKFTDIGWIEQKVGMPEESKNRINNRYKVLKPELTITELPETKRINTYKCRIIKAVLRMETIDKKKNASSITIINQQLWLADNVPGIEEYNNFHNLLTSRLGIDAERLGPLSFLLRYWNGSLDLIRKSLNKAKGYPVKSSLTVEARYIEKTDTPGPRIVNKVIKKESMQLREVRTKKLEDALFEAPSHFSRVTVR